jgi:hypothetical protein
MPSQTHKLVDTFSIIKIIVHIHTTDFQKYSASLFIFRIKPTGGLAGHKNQKHCYTCRIPKIPYRTLTRKLPNCFSYDGIALELKWLQWCASFSLGFDNKCTSSQKKEVNKTHDNLRWTVGVPILCDHQRKKMKLHTLLSCGWWHAVLAETVPQTLDVNMRKNSW